MVHSEILAEIKQLIEGNQMSQALSLCETHQTQFENEALFWLYFGSAALQTRDFPKAKIYLTKSLALDQTLVSSHKNLAITLHYLQDPQALQTLLLANWLDPKDSSLSQIINDHYKASLAFPTFDVVFYTGTPWLGTNLNPEALHQALGGSETAFIKMVAEMAKHGLRVGCFCNTPQRKNYDGIDYIPVEQFFAYAHQHEIPYLVALRFCHPFGNNVKAGKKILWIQETQGCAMDDPILPHINEIDFIFGLSDFQIQATSQHHKIPLDKFYKTKNGFMPELFDTPIEKIPFSLCYISRPERGLKEAIEIAGELKQKFPQLTLHVCHYTPWGSLDSDPYLKPLLPLLKMDCVTYHAGLSKKDLAQLLLSCQLMIYPNVTNRETSCIAAIESMAAGTPVITSDRGALPETVSDNIGGKIIDYQDGPEFIADMVTAVAHLLENKNELAQLAHSTRERAMKYYQWDLIADDWIKFLKITSFENSQV